MSLVTYTPDKYLLEKTLFSISKSVVQAGINAHLTLIDNTPFPRITIDLPWLEHNWSHSTNLVQYGNNPGFGGGHNFVLQEKVADYHLVLNPDLEVAPDALEKPQIMDKNPECGLLTPHATWEDGQNPTPLQALPYGV